LAVQCLELALPTLNAGRKSSGTNGVRQCVIRKG
jgi:hypothetical protein